MNFIKYAMLWMMASVIFISCSKEENTSPLPASGDETSSLKWITSITHADYKVDLYTRTGKLITGYNTVFLRFTDQNHQIIHPESVGWMPMMTMNMGGMSHQHSCPFSEVTPATGTTSLYRGYIVFNMMSTAPDNIWNMSIHFTMGGQNIEMSGAITVDSSETEFSKTYTSVTGNDGKVYLLAWVEPAPPKAGVNDIRVALFQKADNGDFPMVNHFVIRVDPRMPGMGNHGAPGNEDMTQDSDGFYRGKIGLSMSGYWLINLMLENGSGEVIKGEPVTADHLESSLNFKVEF